MSHLAYESKELRRRRYVEMPRDIISAYLYSSQAGELMRGCYKCTRFDVNEGQQQVPPSTGFYDGN